SLDAGEASSLAAVGIAMDMLASGRCDAVVCAGAQRLTGAVGREKLASGGMITQAGNPLGEGAGVIVLQRAGEHRARWTIRDCRPDREALNGNIPGDGVAARIGDTLGASGMASILGATVRTDAAREQTILSKSSLGVAYRLILEADRPEKAAAPRIAL